MDILPAAREDYAMALHWKTHSRLYRSVLANYKKKAIHGLCAPKKWLLIGSVSLGQVIQPAFCPARKEAMN